MKILAFGASNSNSSINQQFAIYASQFFDAEIEVLDLSQMDLPIYSIDKEISNGIPEYVNDFISKINSVDLVIISMAEHNGSYTTAFKNLFDWASRAKQKTFENTKILLLSTSPGIRGGIGVLEAAKSRFPYHGANILSSFSLPNFSQNFDPQIGIINQELKESFENVINQVKTQI